MRVGEIAKILITAETVFVLEEVKFTRKQQYVPGPDGATGSMQEVKVPVDQPTFRVRRFVPAYQNGPSSYQTAEFTGSELVQS